MCQNAPLAMRLKLREAMVDKDYRIIDNEAYDDLPAQEHLQSCKQQRVPQAACNDCALRLSEPDAFTRYLAYEVRD